MSRRGEHRVLTWVLPALAVAAFFALWQILASNGALADLFGVEEFLVPSPAEIADSLWDNRTLLSEDAWTTLQEVLLGFGVSLLVGIAIAVGMHLSTLFRLTAHPLVVASQAVPVIAFAPVLVILLGFGIWPKVVIITVICFFPVTIATFAGLRAADPEAIKLMRTLYASRLQILRRVEAPGALPDFFSGAKIAAAVAPIGAVFAEWVGSSSGLGRLILLDYGRLEAPRMFAAVFVLCAIAILLYGLVALAQRLVVSWR